MRTILLRSFAALACFLLITACGNKIRDKAQKAEKPAVGASGQLGGSPWVFSSGIAVKSNTGYEITLAGMGEELTCESRMLKHPYLSFKIPNQLGRYEFDLGGNGSVPVFIIFPDEGNTASVISRKSVVEVRTISEDTILGGVFAESSNAGSRNGSVTGDFTATICGQQQETRPIEPETGMRQLRNIEGNWIGNGTASLSGGPLVETEIRFSLEIKQQGENTMAVLLASNFAQTEIYWQQELVVSERNGFEQFCLLPGRQNPELSQVGVFQRQERSFWIRLKNADCSESNNSFYFRHDQNGTLRLTGNYFGLDRTRPASKTQVNASGMTKF